MNTDYNGMTLNGRLSKFLYECVIDFDLSSMYPSEMRLFNLAPETMISVLFVGFTLKGLGLTIEDFMGDYICDDAILFGKKWFNTVTTVDFLNEIMNEKDELLIDTKCEVPNDNELLKLIAC